MRYDSAAPWTFLFTSLAFLLAAGLNLHAAAMDTSERAPSSPPPRTWSDSSGGFSVEAQFVELRAGAVILKRTTGELVSVRLDRLSAADQKYVAEQATPQSSPGPQTIVDPGPQAGGGENQHPGTRPAAQPGGSSAPDPAGVTFPSGKSVRPADFFNLSQSSAKGTAGQLLAAVSKGARDASCMKFDGSMVLYGIRQQTPVGFAVSFWPGKDPESCYQRKLMEIRQKQAQPGPQPATSGATPRTSIFAAAWDDVVVRCCTRYDSKGKLTGWLMLWNDDGTKQFFRDSRLACLFQHDEPRSVVERGTGGAPQAVHLLSGWKLEKSYASADEAKADSAGQAALDEIDRLSDQLKTADVEFRKAHKKLFDWYIGQKRAASSRHISGIIASNAAQNAQNLQGVMGAVKDAPASRSYLWSPGTSYLPVDVSP
jgi:hypothetical protein